MPARTKLGRLASTPVLRYGGTLRGLMGNQLVATFAAPIAHEDQAQRAVLAALGLHQRVSEDAMAEKVN